jgi:membrane-associated phospholipid phosphatase
MRSPHNDPQASVPAIALPPTPSRLSGRLALLLAAAAISACSDSAIPTNPTLAAPGAISTTSTRDERATAPATLAWQATARSLVSAHPLTVSPIVAVRAYALLGVAQYGAAVASDEALGITDDASDIGADDGGRAQYESRRGAIGEASRTVLTALFPDAAAALQAQLDAESVGPNGRTHPQFTRGVDIGHTMGVVMTTWAGNDGFSAPWNHHAWLSGTPGQWYQASPTAPPAGFQFPAMRPYFMTSPAQFHPAPPPAFGSAEFLVGLQMVRDIANGPRTADQIRIANFWNLPQGTPTALGYWDEQAAGYIAEHALGDRSASHIFALTNAAAMDATIGCWEAKYTYVLLRPFQNVPTNTTVFPTPNHPSYPSGHSCVSAAAATVLATFFPEKTAELDAGVAEAGLSRVYAGIHYPFDIVGGQALGRSAAEWALSYDRTRGLLAAVGR